MACNICMCGAQAGYMHASDCPFPLFVNDPERAAAWLEAREELRAREAWRVGELARLKGLVGAVVWYYDRSLGDWRLAVVTGIGTKDGYPLADVTLDGFHRWGYGWQFVQSESKPALPDLSQTYP